MLSARYVQVGTSLEITLIIWVSVNTKYLIDTRCISIDPVQTKIGLLKKHAIAVCCPPHLPILALQRFHVSPKSLLSVARPRSPPVGCHNCCSAARTIGRKWKRYATHVTPKRLKHLVKRVRSRHQLSFS